MISCVCNGADDEVAARRQRAAEAGALEAAVAAMRTHPQDGGVQWEGTRLLNDVCAGSAASKQRAGKAGAKDLVMRAKAAFPQHAELQQWAPVVASWL
jgi:hypothetical protein